MMASSTDTESVHIGDLPSDIVLRHFPRDKGRFVTGSWHEDGCIYHVVVSEAVEEDTRPIAEWLDEQTKSLVNYAIIRRDNGLVVRMVFTDVTEAVHARLRWG